MLLHVLSRNVVDGKRGIGAYREGKKDIHICPMHAEALVVRVIN